MGFLMDRYITGERISHLREEKGLSQLELGEALGVSWDTVTKWEDDTAHPDISMLNDLAKALGVSIDQLLEDVEVVNSNQGIDINESTFHVCPVCGNIITAAGNAQVSCCGVNLPALESEICDDDHMIEYEESDGEYYVTVEHEMTKSHYISFLSCVGSDAVHIAKTYPEWYCQARFPVSPKAKLYCYCNRHGLFRKDIRAARKHDEFADLPNL